MNPRLLTLPASHSFYLFGARGTGKSTLLRSTFEKENTIFLDLLDPQLSEELLTHPMKLKEMILAEKNKKWVVIDEVQKVPSLLDIVHQMIEEKKHYFALTGSSARKLKRGRANMLAGRAFLFSLFPLTHLELGDQFDLNQVLQFGSLPTVCNEKSNLERKRYLKSYVTTYLKEEILIEQIIRKLPPFKRFLEIASHSGGEIINYSNIAKDVLSDAKAIQSYYEILEDTLLGFYLPAFHTSIRKQQRKAKKFYFFDIGVMRTLALKIDAPIQPRTYEYGLLFENFIINEIHRLLTYQEEQFKLSYLQTKDDAEIDLIIERAGKPTYLCEIKSTDRADQRYTTHLESLGKDIPKSKKILISQDPIPKKIGTVMALPWKKAIQEIMDG